MPNQVSGFALGSILSGTVLVFAALKGWSIGTTLKDVISGKAPSSGQTPGSLTTIPVTIGVNAETSSTATSGASATGLAIMSDALKYNGHCYLYGGPSNSAKCWDCSSFVSWVLGHDLGMSIPGGSWAEVTGNGTEHGPSSTAYMSFGTAITESEVQSGDLIVTTEHMGIAINEAQMISAQDPSLGTGISDYPAGFPGGTPVYRRVSSG